MDLAKWYIMASRKVPATPTPSGQERERRREGKKERKRASNRKTRLKRGNSGVLIYPTLFSLGPRS